MHGRHLDIVKDRGAPPAVLPRPWSPPDPAAIVLAATWDAPTRIAVEHRVAPTSRTNGGAARTTLDRRGMLGVMAGSTVGLAALVAGCADKPVDEAIARPPTDATLPKARLTPKQSAPGAATASSSGTATSVSPRAVEGPATAPKLATAAPDVAAADATGAVATPAPPLPPTAGSPSGPSSTPQPPAPQPPAPQPPAPQPPAPQPPAPQPPAPQPPADATTPPPPQPDPTPPPPPPPPPPPQFSPQQFELMHQAQLLTKVSYGPTPSLTAEIASLGAAAYLEQQLATPPSGAPGILEGAHTLEADIFERFTAYRNQSNSRPARELRHAAVVRATTYPGQLAERMVEFWTNHFSVYTGEEDKDVRYAAASDDRDVFRVHAMGRFSDLLIANARSVSMLLFLDNFRSSGNRPNQNYAREVMELHTMGAGNGYDEADVEQVARILTGWGLTGRLDTDGLRYQYQPARHFTGACEVTITLPDGSISTFATPAGRTGPEGEADGIALLNWLARLPNTALYLATKLARRFVSDIPPASLVNSTAQVYLANDTAIVPVLRHLLSSEEFITSSRMKVKSPFELLVSMLRATGATVARNFDTASDTPASRSVSDQLDRLGHSMWQWPTPDGFADDGHFWMTTNTALRRWELAGRIGNAPAAVAANNHPLPGIAVGAASLLPSPVPTTVSDLVVALAVRLGVTITETDVTGIATFLQVATDAPTAGLNFTQTIGDIVGLLLSHPSSQYR
jgi:uncharacterized protein (DUF1800 family)